jgi:hypothetical protein
MQNAEQKTDETPRERAVSTPRAPAGQTGRPRRRFSSAFCILHAALGLVLAAPAVARAESPPVIEQVRVGLPGGAGGPESGRTRPGAWAPVLVKLHGGPEGNGVDRFRLVVEAADGEGAAFRTFAPVPALAAGEDHFALAYTRPCGSEVVVALQTADGKRAGGARVTRDILRDVVDVGQPLYLAVGSRLPGLRRFFQPADQAAAGDEPPDERGTHRLAFIDNVRDLPDRWAGYDAADVVVLTTSSDTFVKELGTPAAAPRRRALAEWVRRGGRLVVSVGRNAQLAGAELLSNLPLPGFDRMPLLPCDVQGGGRANLRSVARWAGAGHAVQEQVLKDVELARLTPSPRPAEGGAPPEEVTVLAAEEGGPRGRPAPVIVQAACGLGRVVLVGFDLDTPPFSTWAGQRAFWEKLDAELLPRGGGPGGGRPALNAPAPRGFSGEERGVVGSDMKRTLEDFQDVPVISFGWVALFILGYIILVGPVDYFLLKKVFKRLELTWITFPTAVLVISVAAYFTAYAVKGDALRVNKVDVVDVDLHGPAPQAYGTAWITLFSPRIQNYTVGLEPAAPVWAGPGPDGRVAAPAALQTLDGFDGPGRGGSQALFRRPYEYAPDAAGVEGLPIAVWATRSFSASWRAPLPSGGAPVDAELRHARDPKEAALLGRVTNRLPVELRDVSLLYRGERYKVGTVPPEGFVPIDNLNVGAKGQQALQWLNEAAGLNPAARLVRDLMFHGPPSQTNTSNAGWRSLDQSWRLRPATEFVGLRPPQSSYRDEVILVARTPPLAAAAEKVTQDGGTPTRVWLDYLPATRSERPALPGFLNQETHIRVFIPVQR